MQWASWANVFLAAWLLSSPFTLGMSSQPLLMSDLLSGALAGLLSVWDVVKPRLWKKAGLCAIGTWLFFAPLIFWATSPGIYANDTLVGFLMIVFAAALPSQSKHLSELPPGWSYNPSVWTHRIPIVILAFAGFFIARHMAAFQLGHIDSPWEPFFNEGTKKVLTSEVARSFPISDAGLGATAYVLEGLSGLVGDVRRWRTMPWMVFLFFVLVVPAGVVSIVLIMLQPVVVGFWCTLCLATAIITLISIPPAVDEVFASTQFLMQCRREKKPVWKIFWFGGQAGDARPDSGRSAGRFNAPVSRTGVRLLGGVELSWAMAASAVLGIWIVISPAWFDLSKPAADSDTVVGALITTFAVLAAAEPIRGIRFINIPFGLWVCFTPVIFDTPPGFPLWNHVGIGLLLIGLTFPKGPIRERYGSWDRYIV